MLQQEKEIRLQANSASLNNKLFKLKETQPQTVQQAQPQTPQTPQELQAAEKLGKGAPSSELV